MDSGMVQGCSKPGMKGAEYKIQRTKAGMPHETAAAPPEQARSPKSATIGSTRSIGAGGAKVPSGINTSAHSRAWGLKGS